MTTDIIISILVLILCLTGIAGSILPGLPGIPLNFIALCVVQYVYTPFTTGFMLLWAGIILVSIVLNYFLPIWFAKKYGASKYGIWGSIIGMLVGLFFTPIGMILGMLLGAILGELLAGSSGEGALKSGLATFVGTMLSIVLNVGVSVVLTVYICIALVERIFLRDTLY